MTRRRGATDTRSGRRGPRHDRNAGTLHLRLVKELHRKDEKKKEKRLGAGALADAEELANALGCTRYRGARPLLLLRELGFGGSGRRPPEVPTEIAPAPDRCGSWAVAGPFYSLGVGGGRDPWGQKRRLRSGASPRTIPGRGTGLRGADAWAEVWGPLTGGRRRSPQTPRKGARGWEVGAREAPERRSSPGGPDEARVELAGRPACRAGRGRALLRRRSSEGRPRDAPSDRPTLRAAATESKTAGSKAGPARVEGVSVRPRGRELEASGSADTDGFDAGEGSDGRAACGRRGCGGHGTLLPLGARAAGGGADQDGRGMLTLEV